jgi:hypothetical protein
VDIEWQHNRNRVRRRDPRQELSFLVNKDTNPGIGLTGETGIKYSTEALRLKYIGRGAFCLQRRCGVSHVGADRKANVGISNDNVCEKHTHRKTKVSFAMLINEGLVGS